MNTEKIHSLYNQILHSTQIKAQSEDVFISGHFSKPIGKPDNQLIYFSFNVKIEEQGLDAAIVKGNAIHLIDSEGEEFIIELFELQAKAVSVDWEPEQKVDKRKTRPTTPKSVMRHLIDI